MLDLTGAIPTILRPGGVTREKLTEILGDVEVRSFAGAEGPQISPGLLLHHYSPHAELIYLLDHARPAALTLLRQIAEEEIGCGQRVGVLVVEGDMPSFAGLPVQAASLGPESDLWQAASRLYAGMRSLDEQNVDVILVRDLGEYGPGLALRDRLQRAATKIIR